MEKDYENWVWLALTHNKEVEKCVPTVVAIEGDVSPLELSLEVKHFSLCKTLTISQFSECDSYVEKYGHPADQSNRST